MTPFSLHLEKLLRSVNHSPLLRADWLEIGEPHPLSPKPLTNHRVGGKENSFIGLAGHRGWQ